MTGNLQLKGDLTLHYEDASHAHAATSATKEGLTNTYTYDANGNMETRVANGQSFEFDYDVENRLVSVTGVNGTTLSASFEYDADGARIRSVMDGETIVFIGGHCEIANPGQTQIVTRYYLAGGVRVAMRKGETLSYLLADHISSTSLTTNENGVRTSELRYKAFGETRFSYGTIPTKYTFTGQYSYTDDPSTQGVTEGFGLMFFNARWMDPSLGRFAQPDSIVPTQTQGTQAWDRYAFVNNNPVRYNDPTGHCVSDPISFLVCSIAIGAAAGAVAGAAGYLVGNAITGDDFNWKSFGVAVGGGALAGAAVGGLSLIGGTAAAIGIPLTSGVVSAGQYVANRDIEGDPVDFSDTTDQLLVVEHFGVGAVAGSLGVKIGGSLGYGSLNLTGVSSAESVLYDELISTGIESAVTTFFSNLGSTIATEIIDPIITCTIMEEDGCVEGE